MRSLLLLVLTCHLAVVSLTAQDTYLEKDFQATLDKANLIRETNEDNAIVLYRSALQTFTEPDQQIELLNELGRTYELAWKLDTSITVLQEAQLLAEQHNRKDFLVSIFYNLGFTYNSYGKKQQAIYALQESEQLAIQLNNPRAEFDALSLTGRVFASIPIVDSAFLYLNKALELTIVLGDKKEEAWMLMVLGNSAARTNQETKAIDYYLQSIEVAEAINDSYRILGVYSNMGFTYSVFGNYPKALEVYQAGLQTAEEIEDLGAQADMSMHLGSVYKSLNDLDQAISFYDKAEQIREQEGNTEQNSFAKILKAEVYVVKNDFRKALKLFLEGSQLNQLENKNLIEPHDLINIGSCYEQLEVFDSARLYYDLAFNNATQFKAKEETLRSLLGLASLNLKEGSLAPALSSAEQAYKLSQEMENEEETMKASELLYKIYKKKGNQSLALQYFEEYQALQDTLFSQQNIKQIAQMEVQNQFDQQKQQLEFERQQERQRARSRQTFILIIAGGLALFLFLTYRNVLSKKRANTKLQKLNEQLAQQHAIVEGQKKKLEELDQMKSRFFTNISHEFRTPLTVIGGVIQQIKKYPNQWLVKGSKLIERNNTNLLNLVNQILELRKLESGGLQLEYIQGNVVFYLRYILESFHSLSDHKRISLHFASEEDVILMDYDKEKLLRIVSNLLSNAIKFTPDGGEVHLVVDEVAASSASPFLQITVRDTGIGIPQKKLAHIFDRFYQVDDSSTREGEGTGIGLSLTKELVNLMNGKIEVNSELNKGTSFQVTLPISRNAPIEQSQFPTSAIKETEEIMTENVLEEMAPLALPLKEETEPASADNNKSTLLIIEDNPDLVEYLESLLSSHYDLEIARNGKEGIEIALEQIPDLILSDVMMPYKDGFEVCETLKNDQRTSHIPIVLLTAKADAESRIAGLQRGADAYLAKPFNQKELFVRLEKLRQLRLQLQARYSSLDFSSAAQESKATTTQNLQMFTQAEDEFIQRLRESIEANLDNELFAVPDLCKVIGMSRSQLHRKVKALTNRSTTHYIRSIRLQKAKELLQEGDLNVTQVAYEVGFQNRTYFSRAFSEEFGVSPKDFSNN